MTSLLLLLVAASGDLAVSLTADASAVRLSGTVRLALTVEGPAPLRVDPPTDPLDQESVAAWKLTADGPPTSEGGRWVQRYVADPFVPGEAVRLGFGAVTVWAGGASEPRRLAPSPLTVRVTTGVADVSLSAARPPTGVEALPASPPPAKPPGWVPPVLGGLLVVTFAVITLRERLNRRMKRLPTAAEWLELSLAKLAAADSPPAEFAHRLSDAVRQFYHTPDRPARRLTTPEWLAGPARELLERLDAVRFGGRPLTPEQRAAMLEVARTLPGAADVRA